MWYCLFGVVMGDNRVPGDIPSSDSSTKIPIAEIMAEFNWIMFLKSFGTCSNDLCGIRLHKFRINQNKISLNFLDNTVTC